mmetsp:Transcript_20116/g.41902  ORF Transcript_20116/g.41902 Transcript_20116/m.41902 type:complete len:249 (+) Transcript_20116:2031-2777(+)
MVGQEEFQELVLFEGDALNDDGVALLISVEDAHTIYDVHAVDVIDDGLIGEVLVSGRRARLPLEQFLDIAIWQVEGHGKELRFVDGKYIHPHAHGSPGKARGWNLEGAVLNGFRLQSLVDRSNVTDVLAVALESTQVFVVPGVAVLATGHPHPVAGEELVGLRQQYRVAGGILFIVVFPESNAARALNNPLHLVIDVRALGHGRVVDPIAHADFLPSSGIVPVEKVDFSRSNDVVVIDMAVLIINYHL